MTASISETCVKAFHYMSDNCIIELNYENTCFLLLSGQIRKLNSLEKSYIQHKNIEYTFIDEKTLKHLESIVVDGFMTEITTKIAKSVNLDITNALGLYDRK